MLRALCDQPKEALTALADVLAKRPAEEILFDWFRSGRLVDELSVLIKRRHPEVQAEIDRVYQEHLETLGNRRLASGPRTRPSISSAVLSAAGGSIAVISAKCL